MLICTFSLHNPALEQSQALTSVLSETEVRQSLRWQNHTVQSNTSFKDVSLSQFVQSMTNIRTTKYEEHL